MKEQKKVKITLAPEQGHWEQVMMDHLSQTGKEQAVAAVNEEINKKYDAAIKQFGEGKGLYEQLKASDHSPYYMAGTVDPFGGVSRPYDDDNMYPTGAGSKSARVSVSEEEWKALKANQRAEDDDTTVLVIMEDLVNYFTFKELARVLDSSPEEIKQMVEQDLIEEYHEVYDRIYDEIYQFKKQ